MQTELEQIHSFFCLVALEFDSVHCAGVYCQHGLNTITLTVLNGWTCMVWIFILFRFALCVFIVFIVLSLDS